MENKQDLQLIFFKDLVFATLYRWKWIVAVALIFALLLGGFAMLRGDESVTLNTQTLTPEMDEKVVLLEATKARTEQLIEDQTNYLANSQLMKLDPYRAYTAGFHLSVVPQAAPALQSSAAGILSAYRTVLTDPDLLKAVWEAPTEEAAYIAELISFDATNDFSNTLTVTVRGASAEDAKALREALIRVVQEQTAVLGAALQAHTAAVVPFQNGPVVDFVLLDAQNLAQQRLTTLTNSLVATSTELEALRPTELIPGQTSPLLLAVVGAVLGAVVVVLVAWIAHLGSSKVYSARVLQNRTGITVLNCIRGRRKRGPVELWLRKLEGRSTCDRWDAAAVNIRNRCACAKQLLLLGCYDEKTLSPLREQLQADGIQCVLQGDPAISAAALESLAACDAAVLVQTCAVSRYDQIQWQIQTVLDHNKPLLGCILIDG